MTDAELARREAVIEQLRRRLKDARRGNLRLARELAVLGQLVGWDGRRVSQRDAVGRQVERILRLWAYIGPREGRPPDAAEQIDEQLPDQGAGITP